MSKRDIATAGELALESVLRDVEAVIAKKKPSKTSPTKRTLDMCRRQGWTVQVVERWNAFAKIRQDLFGFVDLVAMDGTNIIAIQSTSSANMAARITKIKAEPRALTWLQSGGRLFVHGWVQRANRRWECRETELFAGDLAASAEST